MKQGPKQRRFVKSFISVWKRLGFGALAVTTTSEWVLLGGAQEAAIPSDVPKGHMVVYVGEELRRYVIRVSSLDHPLFRELLERAREEYEFAAGAGLRIPCDEDMFLGVLWRVHGSQQDRRASFCS